MKKVFKTIGKARINDNSEYTFFLDSERNVYLHYDSDAFLADDLPKQYVITRVVSHTIFFGSQRAKTFAFNTDEEQIVKRFLDRHFPKKDESLIRFIRYLEEKSSYADMEKFESCESIIRRIALDKFGKGYLTSNMNDDKRYYLVEGVFTNGHHEYCGNKIFLQIVQSIPGTGFYIEHKELTPELYFFCKCSEVISITEEALKMEKKNYTE